MYVQAQLAKNIREYFFQKRASDGNGKIGAIIAGLLTTVHDEVTDLLYLSNFLPKGSQGALSFERPKINTAELSQDFR